MISNCVDCNKEIKYSPFAFDPNSEYAEVTMSGLCSNGIDGCWELKQQLTLNRNAEAHRSFGGFSFVKKTLFLTCIDFKYGLILDYE